MRKWLVKWLVRLALKLTSKKRRKVPETKSVTNTTNRGMDISRWILIKFDQQGVMAIDPSSVTDVYSTKFTKEVLTILAEKDLENQYIALPAYFTGTMARYIKKDRYVH